MKIKVIERQHRRDLPSHLPNRFTAIYKCEHCGHERRGSGYDDDNFHRNVIPDMKCGECGKSADSSYRPLTTKYPDGMQV